MARHALLHDNIIKQIVDTDDDKFDAHTSLEWQELDAADQVSHGWIRQADGSFLNPRRTQTSEEKTQQVRSRIRSLLRDSDWTQLLDSGLKTKERDDYSEYRSALVQIAIDGDDPDIIEWPEIPTTGNIRE